MRSRTSAGLIQSLCVVFCAGLVVAQQTRTYRDPAGRFSVPVPPGWTAAAAGEMTMLTSGATYGLVGVVEGGGADPRRVANFTDQFGRQWQQYKRLQNGNARLGGSNGAFALYSGVNPKGVEAVVKALSAPSGTAAYVLIFSCPLTGWESKKPGMDAIERGFAFGRPDAARTGAAESSAISAPPGSIGMPAAPPRQSAPPPRRELPAGFTVVGRNGPSGQALTATFTGGQSAKATFSGVFKFIAP
ncbi:MAG: hypothetical protein NTW28_09455 [Candidatus Solibacter sp.]|nr:hypothetical protein [Candidatus Solibacter sp.]